MQILAEYRPHKGTNNRQQYILSVYIFCHFQIIKSKHFNRCQFPASFCNIDIIQIVQYDKCQHTGGNHQNQRHNVQTVQHFLKLASDIISGGCS